MVRTSTCSCVGLAAEVYELQGGSWVLACTSDAPAREMSFQLRGNLYRPRRLVGTRQGPCLAFGKLALLMQPDRPPEKE